MEDIVVQANGPYLRVVLPDLAPECGEVQRAVAFEVEDGVTRAEIVVPAYRDVHSLACVRELVAWFERNGIDAIVEWQGIPEPVAI
jgi:hypothetical protein